MAIFWFIIWGTKITLKKLGYVADFCPICRQPRPFSVFKVGKAGHIYYISFGDGELIGYIAECQTCHVEISADPSRYQTVSKTLSSNLASLTQETFPNLNQHHHDRLEVERQIKRNLRALPASIRTQLIEEPFHLLSPLAETRLSGAANLDREVGFGCLFTIVAFFLGLMFISIIPKWMGSLLGLAIPAGFIYTIVQLFFINRRYLNRKIVPMLASSLKPLRPTVDELQACLNKLAILKQRLGRQLKAQQLLTAIERSSVKSFDTSNR